MQPHLKGNQIIGIFIIIYFAQQYKIAVTNIKYQISNIKDAGQ